MLAILNVPLKIICNLDLLHRYKRRGSSDLDKLTLHASILITNNGETHKVVMDEENKHIQDDVNLTNGDMNGGGGTEG